MRAVIQRVSEASVTIGGGGDPKWVKGKIGPGLLVLLGVCPEDTVQDIDWLAGKIARMRVFNDAEGLMNLSLAEVQGDILVVSQFTLYASTKKGNRPGYTGAALPEIAIPLYELFLKRLEELIGKKVESGEFGADMKVALVNDGPVTIFIDTRNRE
ncbi:MAG: D-aminoacyl-tRNA deacylase [Limisphaerales bacterium]|jgi:D-tyrosyl-tRNA(Tyr) deacylase|nr:D-aminoacyl-tRNA deacylase [Verrucomicrobiota bacterium]